jgi:hypothetical protein
MKNYCYLQKNRISDTKIPVIVIVLSSILRTSLNNFSIKPSFLCGFYIKGYFTYIEIFFFEALFFRFSYLVPFNSNFMLFLLYYICLFLLLLTETTILIVTSATYLRAFLTKHKFHFKQMS